MLAARMPRPRSMPCGERPSPGPMENRRPAYDPAYPLQVRRPDDWRNSRRNSSPAWATSASNANARSSLWACRDWGRRSSNKFWPDIVRSSRRANCSWRTTALPQRQQGWAGQIRYATFRPRFARAYRNGPAGTWTNYDGGTRRPCAWSIKRRTIISILDSWQNYFRRHS